MADVNIELFLPDVLPSIDQCPRAAALREIRNAAIRFCEETFYDQRRLSEIDYDYAPFNRTIAIVAGQADYTIGLPDGFDLVEISSLSFPQLSAPMLPMSAAQMDKQVPHWRETISGIATHFVVPETGKIRIWPTPDPDAIFDGVMDGLVVLKPTRTGNMIAERIYKDFYETIVAGALARLLMMPGKPWTNAKLAEVSASQFLRGMTAAKIKVIEQFNSARSFIDRPTFGVS